MEIWKDIKGAEGFYQISNYGRVKSLARKRVLEERIITPSNDKDGYKILNVTCGSRSKRLRIRVAACVLETFIGAKPGFIVCHIDGDRQNNRLDNLYYGTIRENTLDKYRHGVTKLSPSDVNEIRNLYPSVKQKDLSKKYGVVPSMISRIVNKKRGVFI